MFVASKMWLISMPHLLMIWNIYIFFKISSIVSILLSKYHDIRFSIYSSMLFQPDKSKQNKEYRLMENLAFEKRR